LTINFQACGKAVDAPALTAEIWCQLATTVNSEIPGPSGSRTQSASVRGADSGSNVANPIIFHHCKPATLATKLQPLRVGNGFSIRDAVMLGKSYKANSFRSK
jgi:hypothetical protein